MAIFLPNMYKKTIFDINYHKLKKMGIKILLFDLDNTLCLIEEKEPTKEVISFIKQLEKDFKIVVFSNNSKKRVSRFSALLGSDYIYWARKPLLKGFIKVILKYKCQKNEVAVIGDQLITDIYGGNKFGILTILIDPLGNKDLKITFLNRYLENKVLKKYEQKRIFKRGEYYE